ncbi:MAG: putative DNA binding domain-containing protein [bacterium]|jgi:ATP-dependent DNA helicase RecG|nr:putative DNA binding domain-containing protein [bacterium]
MTSTQLHDLLKKLLVDWEGECVEFKRTMEDSNAARMGEYFSALSNEANLRSRESAWLVLGVDNKTKAVVGTVYRRDHAYLHTLKHSMKQGSGFTFREIHELQTDKGRVLLFEIPPAPRGIPVPWNGHYYARSGESLVALDIAKLDEIRRQAASEDWSAAVCERATLDDLDPAALEKARSVFLTKHGVLGGGNLPDDEIRGWSNLEFLNRARLTIDGRLTRATLILLGNPQSTHHLSPYVAEMTWKLEGEQQDYEHFAPPFLLSTSRLFQRIRNLRLSLLPAGQLVPVDVLKYDQQIVLEALHNCIAHQDYHSCARVVVIERPGELVFVNAGSFFDGQPLDYVLGDRVPQRYRNRFLAEAMGQLRMVDRMGLGIQQLLFLKQAQRRLPLPDYDLSDPANVKLTLPGRFIDENYSRALLVNGDFSLKEILALDRVQKRLPIDDATLRDLRRKGLVEGRKPALHVSAGVAAATGNRANYILTKRQDDAHYQRLILDFIEQFRAASRDELRTMLAGKWPEILSEKQREDKLHNLLTALKRMGKIERVGGYQSAKWRLASRLNPTDRH